MASEILSRDLHPSETPLFIAAALRGLRLVDTRAGLYCVLKGSQVLADEATFKDIANLCGAFGSTTLREAAERDGLQWPVSPESFIKVVGAV